MAMFVQLASEEVAGRIARNGMRVRRSSATEGHVVFAMPVTRNFFISHQWLRELKRAGQRTIVAVHVRIPDDELVRVGHCGSEHVPCTAAKAVAAISRATSPEGYLVLMRRRIEAREIHAIRRVRQVIGWRYFPGAHGRAPCGCEYRQRGRVGAQAARARGKASQRSSGVSC
jgi:hypothetical protein